MPSPSSTGVVDTNTMFGDKPTEFRATSVLSSPRYRELDRRGQYFECSNHDHKKYDFDGRIIDQRGSGANATMPLLNAAVAPFYVPLSERRPHAPMRLARGIVTAFTNMLFGAQRFPTLIVKGDPDTQDFDSEFARSTKLSRKMIRLRNIGGATGTAGISWCFDSKGRPKVEVHQGKYLYVHEWEDREELVPSWVSEVYLTKRTEWDGQKRKFLTNWYWHRRDWTPEVDVLFLEQLYEKNKEPAWMPDPDNIAQHDDGFCHLTWVQNLPPEDGGDEDGLPDYHGLYEKFDAIDVLNSVVVKGGVLNLDPTLVLKIDRQIAGAMGIQKGSDNSLVVGEEGSADYLELSGTSLEAGVKLLQEQRRDALETAQCVIPDPNEVAAQGISSVALKTIFGPMLGRCEVFRDQYGEALSRLLDQVNRVARAKGSDFKIAMPQKVVEKPVQDDQGQTVFDDEGKPKTETTKQDRMPGEGGDVELSWPPYFPLTPSDQSQSVTTLSTAAGGAAILSQQTATEQVAMAYGVDPTEEWARVQRDTAQNDQKQADQAAAFGSSGDFQGGKTDGPGGTPKPKFGGSKPPFGGKPKGDDSNDGPPPEFGSKA